VAATAPLLAVVGWRGLRTRQSPPTSLLVALVAPAMLLVAIGPWMPQTRAPAARRWAAWNAERGALHGSAAFAQIHKEAPAVLKAAGWTPRRWTRFQHFLELDDRWYSTTRLQRLRETGGVTVPAAPQIRGAAQTVVRNSGYAAGLVGGSVVAAIALAGVGLVRRRVAVLAVAQVAAVVAVAIGLYVSVRFPGRVALPIAVVTAVAVQVVIGAGLREDRCARWRELARRRAPIVAAGLVAMAACGWSVASRLPDPSQTDRAACAAFERRVDARDPALVVLVLQGWCAQDPLRDRDPSYPTIRLGWATFSPPWRRALERAGVTQPADLIPTAVARDDMYLLLERFRTGQVLVAFSEDVPDLRFEEVDASGDQPGDLVLVRARRAASP
jgi:hypothetical protein